MVVVQRYTNIPRYGRPRAHGMKTTKARTGRTRPVTLSTLNVFEEIKKKREKGRLSPLHMRFGGPGGRVRCVVLVAGLVAGALLGGAEAESDFAAWLYRGVLNLPAQTVAAGKLSILLSDFECRGTGIEKVHATRIDPSHSSAGLPALHGVSFNVAG